MSGPDVRRVVTSLEELTQVVAADPGLLLRYSAGPVQDDADGPSRDVESGVTMAGWSVTPLSPEPWWTRSILDWVSRRVTKYAELSGETGRRPWILHGRVVGRGPDHEPLVRDLQFVAWLSRDILTQAERHYTAVFDRGRASDEIRTR